MANENFEYDWTKFGEQMGVFVLNANEYDDQRDDWDAQKVKVDNAFDTDDADREKRDDINRRLESTKSQLTSGQSTNTQEASGYITGLLRILIGSSFITETEVLADLIQKMIDDSQTFKANLIGVQPSEWSEVNDGTDQVSGYDKIRGLDSTLIDVASKLYLTVVDDTGGFFHIDGYNDAAKGGGDLIFHTATYNTIGEKDLIEDNSSGIAGVLDVLVVGPADADIETTFEFFTTIEGSGTITPWGVSQLARDGDDLRIECTNATVSGAETWTINSRIDGRISTTAKTGVSYPEADQDDTSGLTFLINADTTFTETDPQSVVEEASFVDLTNVNRADVDGSRKIYVDSISDGGGFFHLEGFKDSGKAGDDQIFFSETFNAIGDVSISESNGSGIGGTLEIETVVASTGIECIMALRWRVGDIFNFRTDSDDLGLFVSFFRDFFSVAMPAIGGGAETIPDPT